MYPFPLSSRLQAVQDVGQDLDLLLACLAMIIPSEDLKHLGLN